MIERADGDLLDDVVNRLARIEAMLDGLLRELAVMHQQVDRLLGDSSGYGRSGGGR